MNENIKESLILKNFILDRKDEVEHLEKIRKIFNGITIKVNDYGDRVILNAEIQIPSPDHIARIVEQLSDAALYTNLNVHYDDDHVVTITITL